jgi:phage portal protein BeeE
MSCRSLLEQRFSPRIIRNQNTARIVALSITIPDDVHYFLRNNNRLYYMYKGETIPSDDMLHFKHFSFDGILGISVVTFAANQFRISIDSQNYQQSLQGSLVWVMVLLNQN